MKHLKTILACSIILGIHNSNAQNKLVAHEWGTFTTIQTSSGKVLSGMAGETLPDFVHDMTIKECNSCYAGKPGKTILKNVTVQMETPVIYFYSDREQDVEVGVKFANGIINQYYPQRHDGEPEPDKQDIDMLQNRTGWIQWKAKILNAKDSSALHYYNYKGYSLSKEQEWTSPRGTSSNLVQSANGEIEKFLFYRGLANFEIPFHVSFNDGGNIVITNNFSEDIGYVMVYDLQSYQPTIWWSGNMKAGETRKVLKPANPSTYMEVEEELINFKNKLVGAGLDTAEANAMLNTWYDNYVNVHFSDFSNRFKIFWIAPRSFVDKVLPVSINPSPDKLERVFVGRSELFSPEFEKELLSMTDDEFEKSWNYSQDERYRDVFWNFRHPEKDTTIVTPKDTNTAHYIEKIYVLPEKPNVSDDVKIVVYTTFPNSGCKLDTSKLVNEKNNISVYSYHNVGMLTAICNSTDTITIGKLNSGQYNLIYNVFNTSDNKNDNASLQFYVSSGSDDTTNVNSKDSTLIEPKDTTNTGKEDSTKIKNLTSIHDFKKGNNQIIVLPNPFENSFVISFKAEQSGMVETVITDMNGKMVFHLKDKVNAGVYQKEIPLNTILPGIYIATVRSGEKLWSSKIIKR